MAKFVLMLRTSNAFPPAGASPAEIQAILNRYRSWNQGARRSGGDKLKDGEGRVLRKGSVTDGPYAESKEILGGFTILEANDYDDAVQQCQDHPHLDFGSIEIRAAENMHV